MTLPVGRRSIPEHASCIKSLRVAAQPATNLVQEAFLWGDVAMGALEVLPVLKGSTRFKHNGLDMTLVVEISDNDRYEFQRVDGRWRWHGPYVNIHTIASVIFQYRENPSQQEIEWMAGYVESIGKMLDEATKVVTENRQRKAELLRQRMDAAVNYDTESEPSKCFIYLMKHSNGLVKIGRSKNPDARERTLQAEDPRLEMFFCNECEPHIETRLHNIFRDRRIRGEWFNLTPHHIDWITAVVSRMG